MSKIEVGGKLQMELNGIPDKLHSFFIGYVKLRFVIIAIPLVPDVNRPTLLEYLYKGNAVTVRFIKQGTVLGFKTIVAYVTFTPIPLLFLQYPDNIETYNLRKDDRVVCLFPVTVILNDMELVGALSDISKSGCNIVLPVKDVQPGATGLDKTVSFRCPLLFGDPQATAMGMIKQVNRNGKRVELGLKFMGNNADQTRLISDYIEQTRYFMDA
jgi:hypothetical protein